MKKTIGLFGTLGLALCLAGCKEKEKDSSIIEGDYEITLKEVVGHAENKMVSYIKLGKKNETKWCENRRQDQLNPSEENVFFTIRNNSKSDDLVYRLVDGEYTLIYDFDSNYLDIFFDTVFGVLKKIPSDKEGITVLEDSEICNRPCKVLETKSSIGKQIIYIDKETNLKFKFETYRLTDGNYQLIQSLEVIEYNTNPTVPSVKKN